MLPPAGLFAPRPPPGHAPGSLADLVDQAARAAQADAVRAAAEAAAQSGEDLRWALERHSLPAGAAAGAGADGGACAGPGGSDADADAPATAGDDEDAFASLITYDGLCAALAACPAAAAAAGVALPPRGASSVSTDDAASPLPLPALALLPPPTPAPALFLRVERESAAVAPFVGDRDHCQPQQEQQHEQQQHEQQQQQHMQQRQQRQQQAEAAPTDVIAELLSRRAAARQVRAELVAYDPRGMGWLSGGAVERWLADTARLLPPIAIGLFAGGAGGEDDSEDDGGRKDGSGDEGGGSIGQELSDEAYARVAARKVFLFHGRRRQRGRGSDGWGMGAARASSCSSVAVGGGEDGAAAPPPSSSSAAWCVSAAELASSTLALELLEARAWRGRLLAPLGGGQPAQGRDLGAGAADDSDGDGSDNDSERQQQKQQQQQQEQQLEQRRAVAEDALVSNWFSRQSARRALATFSTWDADGSGGLSPAEFARIGGGAMSPLVLSRVFECAVAGGREMSQEEFCDFVLAWDHRHRAEALPYLFRLLDLSGKGSLSAADLYALFREVHALWAAAAGGDEVVGVRDVVDEIRDMVPPLHWAGGEGASRGACDGGGARDGVSGGGITRDALWRSGLSGTVIGMLSSLDEFWAWNNRDAIANGAPA